MASVEFDSEKIRAEFPALSREIRPGVPLVYLDTTATSQKPLSVLEAMERYYRLYNANVHRGIHTLAEESTAQFERARRQIAEFIGARDSREVIFTRNATEAINLVAKTWGGENLKEGDRIVVSEMEHHSNLVPWQMIAEEKGAEIDVLQVTERGELDLLEWERLLERGPKVVCITHMSNVLGTLNPIGEMCVQARDAGAISVVDGAQSAPHLPVDVGVIGADFFAFSGHKMCGPTGIGILWGRGKLLNEMPPFLGGGDMIRRVEMTHFEPNDIPYKFEAGTPSICEAIGLGAAVEYLASVGMESIWKHEQRIISYALERLGDIDGITVYGPEAHKRGGVASFTLEGVHPHDIAQILDRDGVAVRAGHHCAMPLHAKLNVVATARASFYLYNTQDEVDVLVRGISRVREMFR